MGELLLPIGGGGGTSSDELTASKAQVLEGYTAVTKDSNDEGVSGTMQNLSDRTPIQYASDNATKVIEGDSVFDSNNTDGVYRICIRYMGTPGYIIPNTLFGAPGYRFGTVSAQYVLKGERFTSSNGLNITGTMPDNSGLSTNGTVPGISSSYKNIPTREASSLQMNTDTNGVSRISMCPPTGYYSGGGISYVNRPSSDFGTVAASNVRSGQTFTSTAGIKVTGTMSVQSAISFSAAAISYNTIRISWNNPPKGPWQGVFIQMSTGGYPGTGGGSRVYTGSGSTNQSTAGAWNYVDIAGLNIGTTYYFTCTSYVDNVGWGNSYNINATTSTMTFSEILDSAGDLPPRVFYTSSYTHFGCSFNKTDSILTQSEADYNNTNTNVVPDKYTTSVLLITLDENGGNTILNRTQFWVGKQIYYKNGSRGDYTAYTVTSVTMFRNTLNHYQYLRIKTSNEVPISLSSIKFPS